MFLINLLCLIYKIYCIGCDDYDYAKKNELFMFRVICLEEIVDVKDSIEEEMKLTISIVEKGDRFNKLEIFDVNNELLKPRCYRISAEKTNIKLPFIGDLKFIGDKQKILFYCKFLINPQNNIQDLLFYEDFDLSIKENSKNKLEAYEEPLKDDVFSIKNYVVGKKNKEKLRKSVQFYNLMCEIYKNSLKIRSTARIFLNKHFENIIFNFGEVLGRKMYGCLKFQFNLSLSYLESILIDLESSFYDKHSEDRMIIQAKTGLKQLLDGIDKIIQNAFNFGYRLINERIKEDNDFKYANVYPLFFKGEKTYEKDKQNINLFQTKLFKSIENKRKLVKGGNYTAIKKGEIQKTIRKLILYYGLVLKECVLQYFELLDYEALNSLSSEQIEELRSSSKRLLDKKLTATKKIDILSRYKENFNDDLIGDLTTSKIISDLEQSKNRLSKSIERIDHNRFLIEQINLDLKNCNEIEKWATQYKTDTKIKEIFSKLEDSNKDEVSEDSNKDEVSEDSNKDEVSEDSN
ncbi:hypothetical protein NGRA_2901, partial [Nosema granulosis]